MKGIFKKVILLLIIIGLVLFYFLSYGKNRGLRIVKWNNFYEGKSIELFYEPLRKSLSLNEKLLRLGNLYKVSEIASKEDSEINKVLKTTEILKTIISPDDVVNTKYVNGYDILRSKGESKKVSKRDSAIILRDLILNLGYESRIGVFRKENPQFETSSEYYVVEYWSPKFNKWVMVDYMSGTIPFKDKEPQGATDLLSAKGLSKVDFIDIKGEEGDMKIRDFKKYLSSYSIPIDNTLNRKYSNSYICYVTSDKDVDFIASGSYIPPTVFTKNKELLDKSPFGEKEKDDSKAYLIFMKKSIENKPEENKSEEEKNKEKYEFIIDAFKNGSVIKDYYLNINGKGFEKIEDYKTYTFEEGVNTIELSLNGKDVESSVEIIRDKQ
ncbi:hypothetical protein M4I33_09630 [Clostridium sp. LY3-2]|uniref:hypothetical protein n=1 Tax=Clostridium sp. LY3-2 TaxID=2942482 RepID=UPI002152AB82|nr:hypothetical protein [Clostridium sp. LY3-2]MCR6515125.1 hypothetical protein [Clostridium sp. LY3-2]